MLWEEMTSDELADASASGLTAIVPIGSMEKHGPHMPLGTDSLTVSMLARMAAEKTSAVVLPTLYYAYVPENMHFPGTLSLSANTLLLLLEEICDEAARNGFKKILLLNGHGGNIMVLRTFMRELISKRKDYVVYALVEPWSTFSDLIQKITEGRTVGHACELETSIGLRLFPELIKLDRVESLAKTGSLDLPQGVMTSFDWPAYALEGFLGDPRLSSADKGKTLLEAYSKYLESVIEAVQQDERTAATQKKFEGRAFPRHRTGEK